VSDVLSGWSEEFDETEAVAANGIVPGRVLLCVGDKQCSTNVLHIERSESVRDLLIFERMLTDVNRVKVCSRKLLFSLLPNQRHKENAALQLPRWSHQSGLTWQIRELSE